MPLVQPRLPLLLPLQQHQGAAAPVCFAFPFAFYSGCTPFTPRGPASCSSCRQPAAAAAPQSGHPAAQPAAPQSPDSSTHGSCSSTATNGSAFSAVSCSGIACMHPVAQLMVAVMGCLLLLVLRRCYLTNESAA
eukprot:GHRQ01005590.1.p1 GENE.GHRQ01005590.1~~GHRQ01005590.1.p1  ORF type:complete len:134 (+),score=24.18 GHRQ01005590.1:489-890(+)